MKTIKCDFCNKEAYVDGQTIYNRWAFMCDDCFKIKGRGLGLGKGQILKKIYKLHLTDNQIIVLQAILPSIYNDIIDDFLGDGIPLKEIQDLFKQIKRL